MDSLTQAVLGAAVGYAVAGKHHPRRALLYGAGFATLPDLDIIVQYDNALDNFTRHRSFSHSLFIQGIISPILALIFSKLDKNFSYSIWLRLIFLSLTTHALLDAFTVYGTQLWWPLDTPPIMAGSMFIIDPIYTLPLFILFTTLFIRPHSKHNTKVTYAVLVFGCIYLGCSLLLQKTTTHRVLNELDKQKIVSENVLVTAAPFTTLLWRIVVTTDEFYYHGFASVFDTKPNIRFQKIPRGKQYLDLLSDNEYYAQLNWFSQQFNAARIEGSNIIVSDLRMGSEPLYVFQFSLANRIDETWQFHRPEQIKEPNVPITALGWIFRRIFEQNIPPLTILRTKNQNSNSEN